MRDATTVCQASRAPGHSPFASGLCFQPQRQWRLGDCAGCPVLLVRFLFVALLPSIAAGKLTGWTRSGASADRVAAGPRAHAGMILIHIVFGSFISRGVAVRPRPGWAVGAVTGVNPPAQPLVSVGPLHALGRGRAAPVAGARSLQRGQHCCALPAGIVSLWQGLTTERCSGD